MPDEKPMWVEYDLTMNVDVLVGGIPKHEEIVKRWQEARWPTGGDAVAGKTVDEATDATMVLLGDQAKSDEEIAGVWTGFVTNGEGLAKESRDIKAMLKESANVVKSTITVNGKPAVALKSKLAERVFVHPRLVSLGRTEPDEAVERPIHVVTRQGPRTALKRTDVVYDVKLSCRLKVLNDNVITEAILHKILEHASENGLGTDRSQGNGTFTYELTKVES